MAFSVGDNATPRPETSRAQPISPTDPPSPADLQSQPPAEEDQGRAPSALPVADLVGLRFSLVHLRLAGYGLLGVWLCEMLGLLRSPLLREIGTRLHYISQALDLSPLLLVGLVLVAFQGGLQRSGLERRLLPLLFALLPLLSAFHLLMVPASIGNALTLGSKQLEISREQLQSIESQLDRASTVVRSSQDLDDLRQRLNAIPGVQIKAAPNLSLQQAQREVAEALKVERGRVRSTISTNTALSRAQFNRRAIQNAMLATVVGLVLAWMRIASLREMGLSAAYLSWAITADPQAARTSGLQALLGFQKSCLATSYIALAEALLQLSSNKAERQRQEQERQQEAAMLERLSQPLPEPQVPAPWEQGAVEIRSEEWRRSAGLFRGLSRLDRLSPVDPDEEELTHDEWSDPSDGIGEPARPSAWDRRRIRRNQERMRVAMESFARNIDSFVPVPGAESSMAPWRWRQRPSQRQLRKARKALELFATQFAEDQAAADGHPQDDPAGTRPADPENRKAERNEPNQDDKRSGPA